MKCPRCQHENEASAKFCEECAAPLARVCGNCGRQLSPTAKFCPECAHPAGEPARQARFASPESYTPKHLAEKILTSKSALEGERKQVTVLFADMKGSMELLADRDPEEARKILDPVLELMMEAVHRYEGTVNQVMGDGIMALFGAPVAHEDHAVRACYAALRMQEAVRRYGEEARRTHGVNFQIRVGLNSGEVVVRAIGSDLHMDYTAVGQTTHLAARMEQLASPGSVLLTPATLDLVEGYVAVKPLGPVPVKGLAGPVEIYEATGAGSARTRLQATARRGLTRFVGRDAELEQLRRAQQLAGRGHGQVAAIVGEAGVGKSRLVYELTHSHRGEGWLTLETAAVSYGRATSYLPVIELLKSYFKIQDRDDLREIREKVTGKLLTLDEALRPALPAVLALLDVPVEDTAWQALDPGQRRRRTLEAAKRLLLREAREQPLLVIFEDLHWIDGETQAVLDGLVESLGSARVLLLVDYRPEYQHAWGSKTYYSQLRLDALPAESAGELLDALLGEATELARLKQLLVKRGNPFFLEETIRTLVETKVLAGERGRYRLTQPLQTIQVPATVQTILATRIDRLSPEDKRLLQTAAVMGKDVPWALLQAIAEMPEEALRSGLDRLQAADFLHETGLYSDLEYAFKHALTHEVAYGTLLFERRRDLHARVVATIEHLYPDRLTEHIDRLADHAQRGQQWESAVAYSRQAGAKALARSAHGEAAARLEEALVALSHLPVTAETTSHAIDCRLDLKNAQLALGKLREIAPHLDAAESLIEALGDDSRRSRVWWHMCHYRWIIGDHGQALAAGQRAQAIARGASDEPSEIEACHRLGAVYHSLGEYRRGVEVLRRSGVAIDRRSDSPGLPSVYASMFLVWCLAELGEFTEAIAIGKDTLRTAETFGHPWTVIDACMGIGAVYLGQGAVEQAIPVFEHGVQLCQVGDLPVLYPWIAPHLGTAYVRSGRMAEGVSLLEQAAEQAAAMGALANQSLRIAWLGEAHLRRGQPAEAVRAAGHALELARRHAERGHEALTLCLHGEIAADPEVLDTESAAHNYQEALTLATDLGMRPLIAHCQLGLGRLYRHTGKRQEAQEHLTTATTMYREMDMRFWLEQAEAELKGLS